MKTSHSYSSGGRENCLERNTKRGSAHALSLRSIVVLEISHVPRGDCFAALTNRPGVEGDVGSHEVA